MIDKDLLGWGDDYEEELSKKYEKIVKVGNSLDLPQRSADNQIASYCKDNNCEFLTADQTAYTHYFDVGIKTIQIKRYGWDKRGDKAVYLIKIVD